MRSLPLTVCAAAAAAAITLTAPVAHADSEPKDHKETGTVSVSPSTVAPGGEVELWVDVCGRSKSAKGSSDAFVSEARFAPAGNKGLFAEARIRSDAAPRTYDIRVTCQDGRSKATGTVTVTHRGEPSPVAPVRAGGGGTATLAAQSDEAAQAAPQDGPGSRQALTGLALAGIAGAAVAFRSVRRRRPAQG